MPFTISHCLSARSLFFYIRSAAPAVVATLCLFTAVAGCQSDKTENQTEEVTSVQILESASPSALQRASASRTNSGEGLTMVSLADAYFGLPSASQVTVPGGWHVQGRMAVSPCTNLPFASWDAVAPDGQGEIPCAADLRLALGKCWTGQQRLYSAERTTTGCGVPSKICRKGAGPACDRRYAYQRYISASRGEFHE